MKDAGRERKMRGAMMMMMIGERRLTSPGLTGNDVPTSVSWIRE